MKDETANRQKTIQDILDKIDNLKELDDREILILDALKGNSFMSKNELCDQFGKNAHDEKNKMARNTIFKKLDSMVKKGVIDEVRHKNRLVYTYSKYLQAEQKAFNWLIDAMEESIRLAVKNSKGIAGNEKREKSLLVKFHEIRDYYFLAVAHRLVMVSHNDNGLGGLLSMKYSQLLDSFYLRILKTIEKELGKDAITHFGKLELYLESTKHQIVLP